MDTSGDSFYPSSPERRAQAILTDATAASSAAVVDNGLLVLPYGPEDSRKDSVQLRQGLSSLLAKLNLQPLAEYNDVSSRPKPRKTVSEFN